VARFILTSRITKEIVTGVIGRWWGLFPEVAGIIAQVPSFSHSN